MEINKNKRGERKEEERKKTGGEERRGRENTLNLNSYVSQSTELSLP